VIQQRRPQLTRPATDMTKYPGRDGLGRVFIPQKLIIGVSPFCIR
jgi:hypothetical protein